MKLLQRLTLLLLSAYLLTACKKENTGPAWLTIFVYAGQDTTITIAKRQGPLTVTTDNEQVATVTTSNDQVMIKTDTVGYAIIKVTDKNNRTTEVRVGARGIEGRWYRMETVNTTSMQTEVVVNSGDDAFSLELKNALMNDSRVDLENYHNFIFGKRNENSFEERNKNDAVYQGTYTFRNLTITLNYEDGRQRVLKMQPGSNGLAGIVGLTEDLTAYYQQLYPGKNVQKVTVTTYMKLPQMPG